MRREPPARRPTPPRRAPRARSRRRSRPVPPPARRGSRPRPRARPRPRRARAAHCSPGAGGTGPRERERPERELGRERDADGDERRPGVEAGWSNVEVDEVVRAREEQPDRDRLDPQRRARRRGRAAPARRAPTRPAARARPRPPGTRRRPRARAPTARRGLCAHGSGRAPVCRHLRERLRQGLVLAPLGDGHAERAELEPRRAPAQLPEPERDVVERLGPGLRERQRRDVDDREVDPRARRSSSARTARSSSSGESASTSAFGGSVRAGIRSMPFQA